ncbi:alpha/beta hydrolase [Mucilaginibacter sabulilitoris]|uniref:Alpha/beta hydrolase n=1 Tax=Mucilaginibacter sabulilitoris TaxID=1173583 RepID=A0ABZ0TRT8_9SPHI|nr:alpha/beta hydrolase [Mucilaginibacter sabulilitoris]WPU94788.1 alpha/beta hydrolase [Mucilaginibacter sabulilitoris]
MKANKLKYLYANVDGLKIFYREGGSKNKPHMILLNGVPNASGAFQDLMNVLKEDFYLVAPDFPGFGYSDAPSPAEFEYSFDHISKVIERFITVVGLHEPSVYALGYGGPVAFRIAVRKPDLFKTYIFQNSNAYEEGLGPAMQGAAPFLTNRNSETTELVKPLLAMEGLQLFFTAGAKDSSLINPDHIEQAFYLLNRPGQAEIQLDLLYNYGSNLEEYPVWQQFLVQRQPNILLVWGKNDPFFPLPAAEAIQRAVPSAELYVYDTSHLALEEHFDDIAGRIKEYFNKHE